MKLTLERKLLLGALGIVRPVAGKANMPILSHVAISTFEKSVEFICSNLDLTLRAKCDADVDTRGDTTVRVSLLHDLVKSFTGDLVELELVKDQVHVACGKSKYKLSVLPVEDFPPMPRLKDANEIEVPLGVFRELLATTAFSSSHDESRYILNSSLLQFNGDIKAVATDGARLTVMECERAVKGKKVELILPNFAVTELLRLLPDDEESAERKMRLVSTDNHAMFYIGDTIVCTKLIEGNYPNYQQVIPKTKGKGIPIGRADLIACLQRCALVDDICTLEFKKQTLNIRAIDKAGNSSAAESLLIPPSDNIKANFTTSFLIQALSAVEDDEVFFHKGVDEPGVIRLGNKPWCAVIMPRGKDEPATEEAAAGEGEPAETAKAK